MLIVSDNKRTGCMKGNDKNGGRFMSTAAEREDPFN
jgi:hypothetical protein